MLELAVLVGVLAAADADIETLDAWKPEAETVRFEKAAESEAKALGRKHPWAGSYYYGDGLGVNVSLTLAPSAGFSFLWTGCLGIYGQNYGAVREDGGRLHLEARLPNRDGFGGIADELVPVLWGKRHYLVRGTDVTSFCNAVNSGDEPRRDMHGLVLLRDGDEKKSVRGLPVVPFAPEGCFLAKPIEAHVVDVGETQRTPDPDSDQLVDVKTRVTLDVGRWDGVWVGMEFFSQVDSCDSMRVVSVDDHTSAMESRHSELVESPSARPLSLGARVSTCRCDDPEAPTK